MKKVKMVKTVIKPVHEEVDVWITEDGKEFRVENDARKHEDRYLRMKNFKEKYHWTEIEGTEYILLPDPVTGEVREDLARWYKSRFGTIDAKAGWNIVQFDDSGDYSLTYFTSLSEEIAHHDDEMRRLIHIQLQLTEDEKCKK